MLITLIKNVKRQVKCWKTELNHMKKKTSCHETMGLTVGNEGNLTLSNVLMNALFWKIKNPNDFLEIPLPKSIR